VDQPETPYALRKKYIFLRAENAAVVDEPETRDAERKVKFNPESNPRSRCLISNETWYQYVQSAPIRPALWKSLKHHIHREK
jgi:hypothetical protein